MFRGMGSDFEMKEGEGILRVRKKNQTKGKNKIWDRRKKKKGE